MRLRWPFCSDKKFRRPTNEQALYIPKKTVLSYFLLPISVRIFYTRSDCCLAMRTWFIYHALFCLHADGTATAQVNPSRTDVASEDESQEPEKVAEETETGTVPQGSITIIGSAAAFLLFLQLPLVEQFHKLVPLSVSPLSAEVGKTTGFPWFTCSLSRPIVFPHLYLSVRCIPRVHPYEISRRILNNFHFMSTSKRWIFTFGEMHPWQCNGLVTNFVLPEKKDLPRLKNLLKQFIFSPKYGCTIYFLGVITHETTREIASWKCPRVSW